MGEGRHARFTVTSAGVRAKAVAFGVGEDLNSTVADGPPDAGPRYDVTARLEANEWGGAVEPRLVVRSVHEVGSGCGDDQAGCAGCACRARGEDWWRTACKELDAELEPRVTAPLGRAREVLDRRGEGALGTLADLLTTGESLLVACADVSRRRSLFARELDPLRFGRPAVAALSSRCEAATEGAPEQLATGAVWLADYFSIATRPGFAERFDHVFALDPPAFREHREALDRSAPISGEGFAPCMGAGGARAHPPGPRARVLAQAVAGGVLPGPGCGRRKPHGRAGRGCRLRRRRAPSWPGPSRALSTGVE